MRKTRSSLLSVFALVFLFVAPQFANAAKNNTSYLNGKPFSELSAQIQANADSISSLNSTTDAIQAELDLLTAIVAEHETRITANEVDISALLQNFSELSVQVEANSSQISTLITDLEALEGDVAANKAELEGQISALGASLIATRAELIGMLTTLRQEVQTQRQELDAVDAQINAAIAAINIQIQALNGAIEAVRDEIVANQQVTTDALAAANFQINSLLVDVTSLQGSVATLSQTSSDLNDAIQINEGAIAQLQGSVDGLDLRLRQLESSGLIDSIIFEVLNTSCWGGPSNFEFSLNGQSLGVVSADQTNSCTCSAPINTHVFNDIANWDFSGDNTLRFSKSGGDTAFAWARATISRGDQTQTVCVSDYAGGNCDVNYLCNANYTFGNVDQSVVVPNTFEGGGLEGLQAQIDAAEQSISDLEAEVASLQSQINNNDGDITALQSQLAAAQQEINDLEAEVARLHANVDLETFLANLNGSSATIVAGIPSRFDFSDGNTSYQIIDGGRDMFDGANRMDTNLAGNIPYTNGSIVESTSFGSNGRYFTAKYPGLFVMVADNIDIAHFGLSGNLGADGQGFTNGVRLQVTVNNALYTIFAKRTTDNQGTRDPSINQIIVVPGDSGAAHTFDTYTNSGFQRVNGLAGINRVIYLLAATWNPSSVLSDASVINLVRSVLENQ